MAKWNLHGKNTQIINDDDACVPIDVSKRKRSTITQIVTLTEKKVTIDYYWFCYHLIKEKRLSNEDTDLYSVEFYPKGSNKEHQILYHFPFGIPPSREKRDRKNRHRKKNGSFHNQCAFYCKLGPNYIVHIMLFAHPKLKIVGLKNDEQDYKMVACRFNREFEYFFNKTSPAINANLLTYRYFNEKTLEVEERSWASAPEPFGIFNARCEMYNESFQVNYKLDLDSVIDVLCTHYKFHARKKQNYSGVVCQINNEFWDIPRHLKTNEMKFKYDSDFDLKAKVHLFIFSTGKIIMIFKDKRDSNIIYDLVKDMFQSFHDRIRAE